MAMIRQAIFVRHHADHFVALNLGLERTADPAVAAGGNDGAFALPLIACADTSRAQDATGGIEAEIRIGGVNLEREMIAAAVVITDVLEAHHSRHFVQFAFAASLALKR